MELDGWPVGSRVYLEKWVCPDLGRAIPASIPDLGAQTAQSAAISTGDGGTFGVTRVRLDVCPAVTESLRLL